MNIAVVMKDVPDLVEDLEVDEAGHLAYDDLSWVPNEFDEQALEEALIVKEESGAVVTALAIDTGDVDAMLFSALAKGADRAMKLTGDFDRSLSSRARARVLADHLAGNPFDLVLTGVQASDDVEGQLPGLLAGRLGLAHAAVVSAVQVVGDGRIRFRQEYAGGLMAEFDGRPPLVLGVQAARRPPRYASVARVRQMMKTATIQTVAAGSAALAPLDLGLHRPPAAGRAEMFTGDTDEVARRIAAVLGDLNLAGR